VELTAGADLAYLLSDLPAADAAFLVNLFGSTHDGSSERFDPNRVPESVRHLIPRLLALGALRPTGLPNRPIPRCAWRSSATNRRHRARRSRTRCPSWIPMLT
jgi:hypothetical protein